MILDKMSDPEVIAIRDCFQMFLKKVPGVAVYSMLDKRWGHVLIVAEGMDLHVSMIIRDHSDIRLIVSTGGMSSKFIGAAKDIRQFLEFVDHSMGGLKRYKERGRVGELLEVFT